MNDKELREAHKDCRYFPRYIGELEWQVLSTFGQRGLDLIHKAEKKTVRYLGEER